jgi:hypothetical protein
MSTKRPSLHRPPRRSPGKPARRRIQRRATGCGPSPEPTARCCRRRPGVPPTSFRPTALLSKHRWTTSRPLPEHSKGGISDASLGVLPVQRRNHLPRARSAGNEGAAGGYVAETPHRARPDRRYPAANDNKMERGPGQRPSFRPGPPTWGFIGAEHHAISDGHRALATPATVMYQPARSTPYRVADRGPVRQRWSNDP